MKVIKVAIISPMITRRDIVAIAIMSQSFGRPLRLSSKEDPGLLYYLDNGRVFSIVQKKYLSITDLWKDSGHAICLRYLGELYSHSSYKIAEKVGSNLANLFEVDVSFVSYDSLSFLDRFRLFRKVKRARKAIEAEIRRQANGVVNNPELIQIISSAKESRILVLTKEFTFVDTVLKVAPHIIYVVKPSKWGWGVTAMPRGGKGGPERFEIKVPFPRDWCGKSREELDLITKCEGVLSCRAEFLRASTYEAAIHCAHLALRIHESKS